MGAFYFTKEFMAIILVGDQVPSAPTSFEERLQKYDKDLVLTWHKPPHWKRSRPGVWKVEQCVRHFGGMRSNGLPEHTHVCQRVYVMVIQDEDGTPIPLGDHVIEKLQAMRAYSESFGGQTERGLVNFIRNSDSIDEELASKRAAAAEDLMAHNRRYHRVQMNRIFNMIQQHDMRPNR